MKTILLFAAVFGVWVVLIAICGWLLPPKKKQWERMEDMMNDGCQTSTLLVALGFLSVGIVFACVIAFGFI